VDQDKAAAGEAQEVGWGPNWEEGTDADKQPAAHSEAVREALQRPGLGREERSWGPKMLRQGMQGARLDRDQTRCNPRLYRQS
jgi:hypothetical protein